jgi:hypothetical protein
MPIYVFLYTKKINTPRAKASPMAMAISSGEKLAMFSIKLDLNRSLKVIIFSPYP